MYNTQTYECSQYRMKKKAVTPTPTMNMKGYRAFQGHSKQDFLKHLLRIGVKAKYYLEANHKYPLFLYAIAHHVILLTRIKTIWWI